MTKRYKCQIFSQKVQILLDFANFFALEALFFHQFFGEAALYAEYGTLQMYLKSRIQRKQGQLEI